MRLNGTTYDAELGVFCALGSPGGRGEADGP